MKRIQGWLLGVGIVGGVMLGAGNYRDAWLWLYWIAFAATTGYALSAIDDCFSGTFIRSVSTSLNIQQSDVDEILNSYEVVGDDAMPYA